MSVQYGSILTGFPLLIVYGGIGDMMLNANRVQFLGMEIHFQDNRFS